MFAHTSRYYALADLRRRTPDGREISYKERRFLPDGMALPLLVEVTVGSSDRLDLIAARTLGRPELFWRIADANDAIDPFALTAIPGRRLRVPLPQA